MNGPAPSRSSPTPAVLPAGLPAVPKPRREQRAEYRTRALARAEANYRQAAGPARTIAPPTPNPSGQCFPSVSRPAPDGSPPIPPAVVSRIDAAARPRKGSGARPSPHPGPTRPGAREPNTAPKFDTLFADPRHYRGDCRLLRTTIRRGWLDDAPSADRAALVARFTQAAKARDAADPANRQARHVLAECWAWLELENDNLDALTRELRYTLAGEPTGQTTGRPRRRWRVGDFPHRIDANAIRRQAKAHGSDLGTVAAVRLVPADAPDAGDGERVALAVAADARYGWRVWLVCPECGGRRTHLYPTTAGARCRGCAGLAYRA